MSWIDNIEYVAQKYKLIKESLESCSGSKVPRDPYTYADKINEIAKVNKPRVMFSTDTGWGELYVENVRVGGTSTEEQLIHLPDGTLNYVARDTKYNLCELGTFTLCDGMYKSYNMPSNSYTYAKIRIETPNVGSMDCVMKIGDVILPVKTSLESSFNPPPVPPSTVSYVKSATSSDTMDISAAYEINLPIDKSYTITYKLSGGGYKTISGTINYVGQPITLTFNPELKSTTKIETFVQPILTKDLDPEGDSFTTYRAYYETTFYYPWKLFDNDSSSYSSALSNTGYMVHLYNPNPMNITAFEFTYGNATSSYPTGYYDLQVKTKPKGGVACSISYSGTKSGVQKIKHTGYYKYIDLSISANFKVLCPSSLKLTATQLKISDDSGILGGGDLDDLFG